MHFPVILPQMTCERSLSDYRLYYGPRANRNTERNLLDWCTFLELSSTVTRGEQERKASVDYVLPVLIYDNLRDVRSILRAQIAYNAGKHDMLQQVVAIEEFLKFVYASHIDIDDDVAHRL